MKTFISTIKPLSELASATEELRAKILKPFRISRAKLNAQLKITEYEEELVSLEERINEELMKEKMKLETILDLTEEFDLTNRRLEQAQELLSRLFPDTTSSGA